MPGAAAVQITGGSGADLGVRESDQHVVSAAAAAGAGSPCASWPGSSGESKNLTRIVVIPQKLDDDTDECNR